MMTPATPFEPFAPLALRTPRAPTRVEPHAAASADRASERRLRVSVAQPLPDDASTDAEKPAPPAPARRLPRSPAIALAEDAARGDESALRRLLGLLTPRIERVVRTVLGAGHADVDDATQQALLGFVRALPSFRGECEPSHFASRIAARTAIAAAKRSRAARGRRDDEVDVDTLSGDQAPLEAAAAGERAELVRELLARIPVEQAATVELRIMKGWSLGKVAEATGAPINTVRSRVRLAKNALRAAVASEELASLQDELDDEG